MRMAFGEITLDSARPSTRYSSDQANPAYVNALTGPIKQPCSAQQRRGGGFMAEFRAIANCSSCAAGPSCKPLQYFYHANSDGKRQLRPVHWCDLDRARPNVKRIHATMLLLALLFSAPGVFARSPCRYAVDVHFAHNSATLSSGDIERILSVPPFKHNLPVALYMATGHADPQEAGDRALLSRARAAVVAIAVLRAHPELGPALNV